MKTEVKEALLRLEKETIGTSHSDLFDLDVMAVCEALREADKDSERLDWLEKGGCISWVYGCGGKTPHAHTPSTDGAGSTTVRKAIDAAMLPK